MDTTSIMIGGLCAGMILAYLLFSAIYWLPVVVSWITGACPFGWEEN